MMAHQGRAITRRQLIAASAVAGLAPGLMTLEQARAQGVAPKRGGTLTTILTPEPPILILGVNNQGPTLLVGGKIYQSLLKFSPELDALPELAKSWSLSDDKLTYTFHLQSNVKFHDGTPMTADDVIFSIVKFNSELAPRARAIFQKIKSATAPDPSTVVLTLDAPFQPFLLMFDVTACPIVPKHIYDGTDYRTNPATRRRSAPVRSSSPNGSAATSSVCSASPITGSLGNHISTRSSIASSPTVRAARSQCRPAR